MRNGKGERKNLKRGISNFSLVIVNLIFLAVNLFAEAHYTVESIQFIPPVYYVGDRVEIRVATRPLGDIQVAPPRNFPDVPWGEFHDARIVPRDGNLEICIVFTPYQPGSQTIPNLRFGDIVLEGLRVSVRSLTDEGFREPAPPRGALLLPSTRLIVSLIVGLFIALPLVCAAAFIWLRPLLLRLALRYREGRPYRKLRKDLALLRSRIAETDSRRFYISLLDAVKAYLSHHGRNNCAACTTRELADSLQREFGNLPDTTAFLEVCHFGDEVKFGGRKSARAKRLKDIGLVAEFSAELENKRGRHAHF
jgi:hypothetical protein